MFTSQQFLEFFYSCNNRQNLVPWLMGQTGCGKTYAVEQYAAQNNLRMEKIILSGISEVEFLGIPDIDKRNRRTVWTMPEWFSSDENCLLFFDEIDKAHPNVLATILSLISSRELRGQKFNGKIILASQPVSDMYFEGNTREAETMKALRARSIFYKFSQFEFTLDIPDLLEFTDLEFTLPVPTKVPGRILKWINDNRLNLLKLAEEDAKQILSGVVFDADALYEKLGKNFDTVKELIRRIGRKEIDPHTLGRTELLEYLFPAGERQYEIEYDSDLIKGMYSLILTLAETSTLEELNDLLQKDLVITINTEASDEELKKLEIELLDIVAKRNFDLTLYGPDKRPKKPHFSIPDYDTLLKEIKKTCTKYNITAYDQYLPKDVEVETTNTEA
jgi:hypothetical protein